MKNIVFTFVFFLFLHSPTYALIYHYELEGLITYSDYYAANGNDPFADIGYSTFRLFGMWGDLGTEAYITIDGVTLAAENSVNLFSPTNTPNFDVLYYHVNFPNPLGFWHIEGYDTSKQLVSNDESVNWNMFNGLDWQILWIGVNHADLTLPEYWEYDGIITSASLTTSPVPEPATIFLCGIGMIGLVGSRRLRRNISPSQQHTKRHPECPRE